MFTASLALATAACGASLEAEAAEYFAQCMAGRGVVVENVTLEVDDGRHIEVLDWDADQSSGTDTAGDECADETFDRFEISRT